jgi:hypothetical protein
MYGSRYSLSFSFSRLLCTNLQAFCEPFDACEASFDLESVMLQARPEKADRKAAVCQDETQLNTVGDGRRAAPTKTLTFLSRDWWSCF